jgi:hypothetical protein
MTLVRARAPTRCVRIGVADQVKKILGTGRAGGCLDFVADQVVVGH